MSQPQIQFENKEISAARFLEEVENEEGKNWLKNLVSKKGCLVKTTLKY